MEDLFGILFLLFLGYITIVIPIMVIIEKTKEAKDYLTEVTSPAIKDIKDSTEELKISGSIVKTDFLTGLDLIKKDFSKPKGTTNLSSARAEYDRAKASIERYIRNGKDAEDRTIKYPNLYRQAGLARCFDDLCMQIDRDDVITIMGGVYTFTPSEGYYYGRSSGSGLPSYALQDHSNPKYY